jgi:hypothetical protein
VEYGAQPSDGGAELVVRLVGCWEHVDFLVTAGLARRAAVEDRWAVIQGTYVGQTGTLTLHAGETYQKVFAGVKLRSCNPGQSTGNELLTYDLEFSWTLGQGARIARTLVFGNVTLTADNFIVGYEREDGTQWKDVWRAAPIRVPSGPTLKVIRVTAIRKAITGSTALARRQAAEAAYKDWMWTYQGTEATLTLDSVSQGTCHLRKVGQAQLDLWDAVTFELEFVTGYGT